MTHACSHCTFTANFESALKMHYQLHHDTKDNCSVISKTSKLTAKKSSTLSRASSLSPTYHNMKSDQDTKSLGSKSILGRTSSATRLLGKLRARICRSRTLFSHPEEDLDVSAIINDSGGAEDTSIRTEYSPEPVKAESSISRRADVNVTSQLRDDKETFGCHLCKFEADRITVLDRHLLNDHKIGLENLLKLVMAKTKDGLFEEDPKMSLYGIRRPYYKLPDEIIEDGEFIIETLSPKIKILKHASTNTDLQWSDIPDLKSNCQIITAELEKIIKYPLEKCDKDEFLSKMQTLNECMCKFVDSSNTLKKVLAKGLDSNPKHNVREHLLSDQPFFDLCLGDRNTPRMWDRAHSDQIDRSRSKYGENNKGDKKFSSESFYF